LSGVERLDDGDYASVTMGRAAELLGVQPAFLRRLDATGLISPERSPGGHRLYSRRQLELATRLRELLDEGMSLEAAARILALQDDLGAAQDRITELEGELRTERGPGPAARAP
jgi:MerR family transcriptional regulator/heat shock protein HspR